MIVEEKKKSKKIFRKKLKFNKKYKLPQKN